MVIFKIFEFLPSRLMRLVFYLVLAFVNGSINNRSKFSQIILLVKKFINLNTFSELFLKFIYKTVHFAPIRICEREFLFLKF